ncbi:Probable methyltransferase At1g29790 [Linum perenne]
MARFCFPKCRFARIMAWLQLILGGLVILVSLASLYKFYNAGFFLHNQDICRHFYTGIDVHNDGFDIRAIKDRVDEVLDEMDRLQRKLEKSVHEMDKVQGTLAKGSISKSEHRSYLEDEVIKPLYNAHIALRQIRFPDMDDRNSSIKEPPLINTFITEEIRKYITPKENRIGTKVNIYGTGKVHNTIGHSCALMKKELEEYMDYDIGSFCKDDWILAQRLMVGGCDPLPRRRCLTRASKWYKRPYPINESLWRLPEDGNVRWSNYQCRTFACLSSKNPKRGYSKCSGCFEMEKEKLKWVTSSSLQADFLIKDVLAIKPGEVRIGLDSA